MSGGTHFPQIVSGGTQFTMTSVVSERIAMLRNDDSQVCCELRAGALGERKGVMDLPSARMWI